MTATHDYELLPLPHVTGGCVYRLRNLLADCHDGTAELCFHGPGFYSRGASDRGQSSWCDVVSSESEAQTPTDDAQGLPIEHRCDDPWPDYWLSVGLGPYGPRAMVAGHGFFDAVGDYALASYDRCQPLFQGDLFALLSTDLRPLLGGASQLFVTAVRNPWLGAVWALPEPRPPVWRDLYRFSTALRVARDELFALRPRAAHEVPPAGNEALRQELLAEAGRVWAENPEMPQSHVARLPAMKAIQRQLSVTDDTVRRIISKHPSAPRKRGRPRSRKNR